MPMIKNSVWREADRVFNQKTAIPSPKIIYNQWLVIMFSGEGIVNTNDFKSWLTKLHKKPINKCFHENCLLANWYTDTRCSSF